MKQNENEEELKNISSDILLKEIDRRFEESKIQQEELKKMMFDLEVLNKNLSLAEKNKTNFLSLIKNEFNNPIASILSLLKSLVSTTTDDNARTISTLLIGETQQLGFQIKNILASSEIEGGVLEMQSGNINFEDVFLEVREELYYLCEVKKPDFEVDFKYKKFRSDPGKILLILSNLISNAIEFSPNNTTIKIKVNQNEDNSIDILVKDEGEGIKEEEIVNIFKRFHQSHTGKNRQKRGLGLGASVAKGLIEFLDGTLKVESKLGNGTDMIVHLPNLENNEEDIFGEDFLFDNEDFQSF
ncbi:HAMP domain-containing histidine kinase [bacterium]|jgi:signal transduction histidine kinase|nr:HAMP domain-containing histidine kinase [bacterium]